VASLGPVPLDTTSLPFLAPPAPPLGTPLPPSSALSEHLEPLYLENLAAAIARARELQGQQGR
jgi:hypothetical protein